VRFAGRLSRIEFTGVIDNQHGEIRASVGRLPLYGLADWSGLRLIGPWSWADGVLDTSGLDFGVPRGTDPWAEIISTLRPPEDWVTEQHLAQTLGAEWPVPASAELTIEIDGVPRTFQHWPGPTWYAALSGEPGLVIAAAGLDPDDIKLITVTDVEPYLASSRAYLLARYDAAGDR
jgi:hypothetical protein